MSTVFFTLPEAVLRELYPSAPTLALGEPPTVSAGGAPGAVSAPSGPTFTRSAPGPTVVGASPPTVSEEP